ncbi:DUF2235 domain-containing protein [Profundibacterium mesophilum]|uniref:Glutathione S-transferase n=1 Tax=Profundibacterium mesophilum KAUST100406-0324 TaxID=1037889 RepID=A0A921NQ94_9RHOB|nr:DUF2235 domain-containing protein [Profundibacterium mesophilum]KAF0676761.1 glutathione S-transferase [Profundibacterium mesophilum KAUST100406-0324]
MSFGTRLWDFLDRFRRVEQTPQKPRRGPVDHVVILDGTMSSLAAGRETNAGLTWKLLAETLPRADLSLRYEAGIQFDRWGDMRAVIEGRGINRQIRRAYGALASRYRPGDRIFLFGYSRGAYAVRSLAGIIDRVGLVRHDLATERNIQTAYRHYRAANGSRAAAAFSRNFCVPEVEIEMIGVWDTVKALGLRLPFVWQWSQAQHAFHNHDLGRRVRHGYHALALDETRIAYSPVLWTTDHGFDGRCEQVWFRGMHGDVGGQLDGMTEARPLANIPLVWMLERADALGLRLPEGWQARFAQDPHAPSIGKVRGYGKLFVARRRRMVGADPSESIHPTAAPAAPVSSLP